MNQLLLLTVGSSEKAVPYFAAVPTYASFVASHPLPTGYSTVGAPCSSSRSTLRLFPLGGFTEFAAVK